VPLTNFSIQNEGGLQDIECRKVPQLMVIAGPNGVGKSTLLEQIHTQLSQSRQQNITSSENVETVYFSPHRAPSPSTVSTSTLTTLQNRSSREMLGNRHYDLESRNSDLPNQLRGGQNRNRHHADFAPYFEVKKRLAQFEYQKGDILSEVYNERGEVPSGYIPDFNKPLKSAIKSVLPGVEYQGVKINNDNYQITFENRAGEQVKFDHLSSGEKDAIAMLFLLVEKQIENLVSEVREVKSEEEDLVALIDSPESHLHPAMQGRFFNYLQGILKSSEGANLNLQVLICTHSRTTLNNCDMENIYFLMYSDQRSDNQLVHADRVERSVLDEALGDLGISALSAGKPLLLVEGKMDRDILTRICPNLGIHFEITPMGGKQRVQNANRIFSRLSSELSIMDIDVFGIVDRDRETDNQSSGPFYTLSRTCIENFLLNPEALYNSITTLAGDSVIARQSIEHPDDIATLIENIIESEEFKQREMKKRLNEKLRFNVSTNNMTEISMSEIENEIDEVVMTKKNRIQDQLSEVERTVDKAIKNDKINDLDGKLVFSEVSSELGLPKEQLKRTTADKINKEHEMPPNLSVILSDLFKSIGESHSMKTDSQ